MNNDTGILLTNTGTPDAANWAGVAKYLAQFLSDRRIVKLPRVLWYPVLFGLILPFRSASSAKLYQNIWQKEGSPLFIHMQSIAEKLATHLNIPIAVGMNYGNPSIPQALTTLKEKNVRKLIVIPLYPQYSSTSTASSFDRLMDGLQTWEPLPDLHFIHDYADHSDYIDAICESIQSTWQQTGKKFLLFSYHGIPQRYVDDGDPYPARCQITTDKIVERLGLGPNDYRMSFQSRTGPAEWLRPYTENTLKTLADEGITDIHAVCPGFAVDCLETIEEIDIRGRETFMEHGGKHFKYIPALNDSNEQIRLLSSIYKKMCCL